MRALDIYAGNEALKQIKENGFTPNLFSAFLGASGGPKWFVLSGLDKVIFSEFLDNSQKHIDIIGSSVGSFRAACFAQQDSAAAITRLENRYSTTVYSDKPTAREITQKGEELLRYMLDDVGVTEVIGNQHKSVHIVIARCHGVVGSEKKMAQGLGLAIAGMRNLRGRKHLAKSFTRAILHSGNKTLQFVDEHKIPTEYGQLNKHNIHQALMASGSIPMVIEGVENISGLAPGMFRDGGIIDYHFDMKIKTPGMVLYPHFYPTPIPGWFDKGLRRQCNPHNFDNVVIVSPSQAFVDTLPYGKITDRKDFETMDADQRIKYWKQVISESDRLAESFFKQVESPDVLNFVQPITLQR